LTDYLTEQEQVELLKNWIKQYSLVILAGVVIAFLAIFGWRTWQQRQIRIYSHASSVYDDMLTTRAQNDPAGTLVQAKKLFNHYSVTTYGPLAAFMLARVAAINGNYPEAEKKLNWALRKSDTPAMRQIARIRLGRVFIAQKKYEEAIHTLEKIEDKSFNGLTNEVKGDALYFMGDKAKARDAYKQALNELPNAEVIRPLLQMKYDNLATIN
jgi:predicted negative regulator of RcsB-dependent stress response